MTLIPIAEVPGTVDILHNWPGSQILLESAYLNSLDEVQGLYLFEKPIGDTLWHDSLFLVWAADIPYPHVGPLFHVWTDSQIFSITGDNTTDWYWTHTDHQWRASVVDNTLSMTILRVPEPANNIMWFGFAVCMIMFFVGRLYNRGNKNIRDS